MQQVLITGLPDDIDGPLVPLIFPAERIGSRPYCYDQKGGRQEKYFKDKMVKIASVQDIATKKAIIKTLEVDLPAIEDRAGCAALMAHVGRALQGVVILIN